MKSLDKADNQLEDIWQTEEEEPLQAYCARKLRGILMEKILIDEK